MRNSNRRLRAWVRTPLLSRIHFFLLPFRIPYPFFSATHTAIAHERDHTWLPVNDMKVRQMYCERSLNFTQNDRE